jgi:CRISPR type III-B/RAMP module RAMP protein Cmr1
MDENTNWSLIQEKVKEKNWLFTIRFTNSSYLRVGGYNARPYSIELNVYEKVRSSKIKGFLRWWTRVLTLGQNPSLTNYKDADEEISKYVGSEKKEFGQSKFFLDIKYEINKKAIEEFRNRIPEIIDYITNKKKIGNEQLRDLGDVARIKLISLERKEEKDKPEKYRKRLIEELSLYPPYSITVTLSVYTYKSDKSDFTHILASGLINLLGSAILMLIFSGFSAFSARGFAGCKLLDININPKLNDIIKSDLIKNIYNIYNICKEIINSKDKKVLEENIKKLIKSLNIKELKSIPNIPTLDSSFKYFQFRVFEVKQNYSTERILKIINESVMKATWKRLDRPDNKQAIKIPGEGYHTWILGLPRTQRNTGYVVFRNGEKKEAFRRKSAIGINIFENNNKKFVILHGFISNDWPVITKDKQGKELILKHLSSIHKKGEKEIIEKEITKIMNVSSNSEAVNIAFDQAFRYIEMKLKEVEGGR